MDWVTAAAVAPVHVRLGGSALHAFSTHKLPSWHDETEIKQRDSCQVYFAGW
jgi:hypothetical protein